ncbi:hypothetical protein GCM10023199_13490 [Actinomycetospora chibensis]
MLPPDLLDGAPLVADLFLDALAGSPTALQDLVDVALGEALAAIALEVLIAVEADTAQRQGRLPGLPPGCEARLVAAVRRELAGS